MTSPRCTTIWQNKFSSWIKISFHVFFLLALFLSSLTYAQDLPELRVENSIQAGTEFDTNVYKSFQTQESDFLFKALFISRLEKWLSPKVSLGWDYQGGGKKFFHNDQQDQIIQNFSIPLRIAATNRIRILLEPDLKYQNENNQIDFNGYDLNEDFISTRTLLKIFTALPNNFYFQPEGAFTFFHFYPDNTFSFTRQEVGFNAQKRFKDYVVGLDYNYLNQQFRSSFRKDTIHEVGPFFQYIMNPFVSVQYAYQNNQSNDQAYSFNNHKINFLLSFLFGKIHNESIAQELAYRFSFHVIGTYQLKNYSSVTSETPEGIRYLVTSSEDENFNNFVVKLNYHFQPHWTLETKYTRISNELSSQQINFSRAIYYGGLRYDF